MTSRSRPPTPNELPPRRSTWPDCNYRTRHRAARPSGTSCVLTVPAIPVPSGASARPCARLASAATASTGRVPQAVPTSPTRAARSPSSSTGATGITARSCYPNLPKSNPEFWARKFELNRERDARKRANLEAVSWIVFDVGRATSETIRVRPSTPSLQRCVGFRL